MPAAAGKQGRTPESFQAIERLCYIGSRGMGALEFAPALGPGPRHATKLRVDALVALASEVLRHRNALHGSFDPGHREGALQDILRVGTSAGGARAKAIIAWNPETNEVRSGQVTAPEGFGYWLLKFDGISGNREKGLEDPKGYTVIEYAYSLMARDAGIEMAECRLLEEGGRQAAQAVPRRARAPRPQCRRRALLRASLRGHPGAAARVSPARGEAKGTPAATPGPASAVSSSVGRHRLNCS